MNISHVAQETWQEGTPRGEAAWWGSETPFGTEESGVVAIGEIQTKDGTDYRFIGVQSAGAPEYPLLVVPDPSEASVPRVTDHTAPSESLHDRRKSTEIPGQAPVASLDDSKLRPAGSAEATTAVDPEADTQVPVPGEASSRDVPNPPQPQSLPVMATAASRDTARAMVGAASATALASPLPLPIASVNRLARAMFPQVPLLSAQPRTRTVPPPPPPPPPRSSSSLRFTSSSPPSTGASPPIWASQPPPAPSILAARTQSSRVTIAFLLGIIIGAFASQSLELVQERLADGFGPGAGDATSARPGVDR